MRRLAIAFLSLSLGALSGCGESSVKPSPAPPTQEPLAPDEAKAVKLEPTAYHPGGSSDSNNNSNGYNSNGYGNSYGGQQRGGGYNNSRGGSNNGNHNRGNESGGYGGRNNYSGYNNRYNNGYNNNGYGGRGGYNNSNGYGNYGSPFQVAQLSDSWIEQRVQRPMRVRDEIKDHLEKLPSVDKAHVVSLGSHAFVATESQSNNPDLTEEVQRAVQEVDPSLSNVHVSEDRRFYNSMDRLASTWPSGVANVDYLRQWLHIVYQDFRYLPF